MQTQLFAVPSGNQRTDQSTCSLSQVSQLDCVNGMLFMSTIRDLSRDLLNDWDKHYPASNFKSCKYSRVYTLINLQTSRFVRVSFNGCH
jgi:hypothetical protein